MPRKKEDPLPILTQIADSVREAFKSLGSIESRAQKSLEKYKRAFQGWIMKVAVIGLSIFMSLAFLVLGLFFIAIDYGGIPRGVVFTCGGLLGLLVLKLMVPSTK